MVPRSADDARRSFWELFAEHGIYAEAVSDEFLDPNDRLGAEGATRLSRLGWAWPPNVPNWSRVFELRGPEGCSDVARHVLETFVDAFRVGGPLSFGVGNAIG